MKKKILILVFLSLVFFSCNRINEIDKTNNLNTENTKEATNSVVIDKTKKTTEVEKYDLSKLNIGDTISGFKFLDVCDYNAKKSKIYFFEHEKTGAEVVYIANDDINRSFSISFRTFAKDDKGIPHVFEHATLGGSKKYPNANLAIEVASGTYNTYVNAITSQFSTNFLFSSLSDEQLFKDFDLYMNGVLYPLVMDSKESMKREAYRYVLNDINDDIEINGTVYNEMKGRNSSINYVAFMNIKKSLYGNSILSNIAGGVPKNIKQIEYNELKDFHNKYYHPSNMIVSFFGDIEIYKYLEYIDNNIKNYDKKEKIVENINYIATNSEVEKIYEFPVAENENVKNASVIGCAIPIKISSIKEDVMISLICSYLNKDASYFKKVMKEKFPSCGTEVDYDNNSYVNAFMFSAINFDENKKEDFKKIVKDSIMDIIKNGFDRDLLMSIIDDEKMASAIASEKHNGIDIIRSYVNSYVVNNNKYNLIECENAIENANVYLENNEFNDLFNKYFSNIDSIVTAITIPKKGLLEENEKKEKQELEEYKNKMTNDEKLLLIEENKKFNIWQEEQNNNSLIDKMKVVDSNSIKYENTEANIDVSHNGKFNIYTYKDASDKYETVCIEIDSSKVPFEMLKDYVLFIDLLLDMDVRDINYIDYKTEVDKILYSLSYSAKSISYKGGGYKPVLEIKFKVLEKYKYKALEYVMDILNNTNYSNYKRLKEAVEKILLNYKITFTNSPQYFADIIISTLGNDDLLYSYNTQYFPYIEYLKKVLNMSNEELDKIVANFEIVKKSLLASDDISFYVIGNGNNVDETKNKIIDIFSNIKIENSDNKQYKFEKLPKNIAIAYSGTVNYCYQISTFSETYRELSGKDNVFTSLVDGKLLIPELRYKKGSYSASMGITNTGIEVSTYRDPNLKETYDFYANLSNEVMNLKNKLTEEDIEGAKLKVISDILEPLSTSDNAELKIISLLKREPDEDKYYKLFMQAKEFTKDDLDIYAKYLDQLKNYDNKVCVGNNTTILENKNMFDLIYSGFME